MKKVFTFIERAVISLFVTIAVCIVLYELQKPDEKMQAFADSYFQRHQVKLTGIVKSGSIYDHDIGMVILDVKNSNVDHFDPFELKEPRVFYYLNDKYAEIYCSGVSEFHSGDSVVIESSKGIFTRYKKGVLDATYNLHVINLDKYYYFWIKDHHKMN